MGREENQGTDGKRQARQMAVIITQMVMENFNSEKMAYERAKKRAKEIRGFYYNLTMYCIIIPILIIINLVFTPEFQWFWFSMLGWGTGLLCHGMAAFGYNPFLGKNWEEKKIKEIIEKEKRKQDYYKQNIK